VLSGGNGNDVLVGGPATGKPYGDIGPFSPPIDELYGGGGNDILIAGRGRTLLDGGPGNDIIDALNGRKDTINCGPGDDVVIAQKGDQLENCEHILTSLTPKHASKFVRARLRQLERVLRNPAVRKAMNAGP
jgi:Ca2+-binding RTX toxin-like protein